MLCVCQAVLSFGLGLAFPFFAIYLQRERGLPMAAVGGWLSLSVLATGLSQGLGGELSDRLGRRRVMSMSLWSRAGTVLALAASIHGRWSTGSIVGLHIVSSFVANFFEPAARSWIADHTKIRERHHAYGLFRTATHGGFALGPALGGLLADRSYALIFLGSAIVCAVCAMTATAFLRDDSRVKSKERFDPTGILRVARDGRFLRLCLLNGLISVAMAQLVVPLSVYATRFIGLRDSQVGLLLSLNGLLIIVFQLPTTRILTGIPLTSALAFGSLMYAAGYAWVGAAGGMAGLAGAVAVITIGEVLVPAAVHALAANMSPPESRGRYLGFFGLSRQIGSAIGPVAGLSGMELAAGHGLHGHWLGISAISIASAVGFHALRGKLRPAEEGMVEFPLGGDEGADPLMGT
jgi:MFS family permease